jgi:hypothetical protein
MSNAMTPQVQMDGVPFPSAHPIRGLLTIFFSPAETFERAGPRPWLVPMIAVALLALLINVAVIQVMGMGTIVRNQIEANTKIAESLGPEKINQMAQDADSGPRKAITYAMAVVGAPVFVLCIAGITFGALLVTGATTKFHAVVGATAWSAYAVLAVTAVGTLVFLAAVKDFSGVDPQNMLMLNGSIFFDRQTSPAWLRSLAGGVDLIAIWGLFIRALGLTRLSERVSMAQAAGVVGTLYVLYVIGKTGFAAMFG